MHNRPELADKVGSHIAECLHISTGSCMSVVIGYCLSVTLVRCRYRTLSCSIVFAFCLGWLCFWSVQVETGTIQRALLCPRDLVHSSFAKFLYLQPDEVVVVVVDPCLDMLLCA